MRDTPIDVERRSLHILYAHFDTVKCSLTAHNVDAIDPAHGTKAMLKQVGYEFNAGGWKVENAGKRLRDFIDTRIDRYPQTRDYLAVGGTSRLSAYLRFGLLSPREWLRAACEREHGSDESGSTAWINELIWRDFYAMILCYFPQTIMKEFQEKYQSMKWSKDPKLFERFANGMTGYPIVDAAMRQLLTTGFRGPRRIGMVGSGLHFSPVPRGVSDRGARDRGNAAHFKGSGDEKPAEKADPSRPFLFFEAPFMHNRARMIVASFMSKDLLLDWQMGEEHFAQYLMDYELASNVGGWRWASSVGTDAQLQSRKYDPDGDYIRKFVPELRHLSNRDIHAPWLKVRPRDYPEPIVDHDAARAYSVAMFKAARKVL